MNNNDLLCLLVDAVNGNDGLGPLCDFLKEKGYESTSNRLWSLLTLKPFLKENLKKAKSELKELRNGWRDGYPNDVDDVVNESVLAEEINCYEMLIWRIDGEH